MAYSILPKIPGMGYGEELLRTDYRKCQLLNSNKGVTERKPGVQQTIYDTHRIANTQLGGNVPNKISLDRKVLRFQAFFKEGVHESPLEQERLRKCIIFYFLEDDTISVSEPKQDNSGIPGQGALIKRHQVPRPDGGAFSFEDFNIGKTVSFYGKTFYMLDCDAFTRRFLLGLGIDVPEPETFPDDNYTSTRRRVASTMVPKKIKTGDDMDYAGVGNSRRTKLSAEEIAGTKQFLAHDKEVLRFYCMWDDRASLYGDVRLFTLHYFLSDDTIEVTESNPPNCGRDPFPSFVKRSKVPKQNGNKFFNPNAALTFKKEAVDVFTDADLMIGITVTIYGRDFLIYDVDDFTRAFLSEKYGITDFTPINIAQPGPPKVDIEPPPYNGFGDEQDSLGSWKYLVLKAPRKDVKKFMEHANHQLKFQLRMEGGDPSNAIRRFVLTYFLADDTISIFEPAQRNSGIIGGKFLQRSKVKKVGPDGMPTGEYIGPTDLFVGARIVINTHHFVVYSTDERSLVFMEQNPEQYPKCNVVTIITKLRAMLLSLSSGLKQAFVAADIDGSGKLDFREFATIIEKLHLDLSEQEILTLMRHFDRNCDGQVSWEEFYQSILPQEVEADYCGLADKSWSDIKALADQQEADEVDRFRNEMAGSVTRLNYVTDMAVRQFLEKYNLRRVLFQDSFKMVADHSPDGCIGEAEFRKACQKVLKLDLPENILKAIVIKLFPPTLKRVPLAEFKRILAGTSTLKVV